MHCLLVLAEHRLSNHVFESLAIVPPQPKTLEMQVITSLCGMSHDFKTRGSTVRLLFFAYGGRINGDMKHSLNISKLCPSWSELPRGISHVRNDGTPFKEPGPLSNDVLFKPREVHLCPT